MSKQYAYDESVDSIIEIRDGVVDTISDLNDVAFLLNMYYTASKKDSELIKKLRKTIHELRVEVKELETFKKILEFAEKDMEERADWQAYCEKEFGGL